MQKVGRNMIDTKLTSKVKIGKHRALLDDKEVNERQSTKRQGSGHRQLTL